MRSICVDRTYLRYSLQSIATWLFVALSLATGNGADVIYTDGTFSLQNYLIASFNSTSATGAVPFQDLSIGNPPPALHIEYNVPSNQSSMLIFINSNSFVYDPATQGAIATIDARVDKAAEFSGGGISPISSFTPQAASITSTFRSAIFQDGNYYLAAIPGPFDTTLTFINFAKSGLVSSDFSRFDLNTGTFNGALHPNFNGSPIRVGLASYVFADASSLFNNLAIWYDNLVITFHPSCQVNVTSWKQYTPWGINNYDQSYISTTQYASPSSIPVSKTGQMELLNGTSTFGITLNPGMNNLNGLATIISSIPGTNAVVGPAGPGKYNLSVYNTRCQTQSCFQSNGLHLCDGTCAAGPDILTPKLMRHYGCAVTALAMALKYAQVNSIQETSGPVLFNPLELNQFMSNTISIAGLGGAFSTVGDVDFANTPRYVGTNKHKSSLLLDNYWKYGGNINSDSNLNGAEAELDQALCTDQVPFIVKVRDPLSSTSAWGHYVLVTGRETQADGSFKYIIEDPGGFATSLNDFVYTNSLGKPEFITRGAIKDPSDLSEFNVSTDNNANVLVKDMNGNRTGVDPLTQDILQQIPGSAYFQDQIGDDVDGSSATGENHMVQILTPVQGTYQIVVTGLQPGLYSVLVHLYSQDGSPQALARFQGIAALGSSSSYQIQYTSTPGATSSVLLGATFQSTLADISNALQLGLIDNQDIANSLSEQIQAAQTATSPARNNILNAFKNLVNAQSGNHITGIAPQVLLQDADSLISQKQ
jgi:hypothetical protein